MSQLFGEGSAQVFWESIYVASIRAGHSESRASSMADFAERKRYIRLRDITHRTQAVAQKQLKVGK